MTWQTCFAGISLKFSLHGRLENTSDPNFRQIRYYHPVLAYALDLGNITMTSNTLVFGIRLIRDPVVSYRTPEITEFLSHLWYSRWNNIGPAVGVRFEQLAPCLHRLKYHIKMISSPLTLLPLLELMHWMIAFSSMHLCSPPNFVCQPLPLQSW